MQIMHTVSNNVHPSPILLSGRAVQDGRASWLGIAPAEEWVAVEMGKASWLGSRPEGFTPPCCGLESEPCLSCKHFPEDDGRAEFAAEFHARIREEQIEAGGMLVDCVRCSGRGFRQLDTPDGIETEVCSTCDGEGVIDHETAEIVRELMDRADELAWGDDTRWTVTDYAPELPLAELVDAETRRYRSMGTAFGELMAEKTKSLADEIRFLGATTVDQYQDRREAAIDCARDAAEARLALQGMAG